LLSKFSKSKKIFHEKLDEEYAIRGYRNKDTSLHISIAWKWNFFETIKYPPGTLIEDVIIDIKKKIEKGEISWK